MDKQILQITVEFTDGDTRTLELDDPKAGLTAEQVNAALRALVEAYDIFVDDKDTDFELD